MSVREPHGHGFGLHAQIVTAAALTGIMQRLPR